MLLHLQRIILSFKNIDIYSNWQLKVISDVILCKNSACDVTFKTLKVFNVFLKLMEQNVKIERTAYFIFSTNICL